jgi:hypothetical protein
VDGQGNPLANFATDANYTVTGPGGSYVPQARTQGSLPNTYLQDNAMPGSRWDYLVATPGFTGDFFAPSGNFVFRTTVNLDGFDATTAAIRNLMVSADNATLSVAVNGTTVFTHVPVPNPFIEEFGFVLNVGDVGLGAFHAGSNTIDVTIFNGAFLTGDAPSPAAFRATGTVEATSTSTAVPEPASLALAVLGGFGMVGFRMRRRTA